MYRIRRSVFLLCLFATLTLAVLLTACTTDTPTASGTLPTETAPTATDSPDISEDRPMAYDEEGHWYTDFTGTVREDYAPHDYTETVVEPTCTEGGYTLHECTCGYCYTDGETEATGHACDTSEMVWDSEGHWYSPTCGHTDARPGYAAHSFTGTVVEPTCTEDGYTLHECACGYRYTDGETEATGHACDTSAMVWDSEGHWYSPTCGHTDARPGYAAHDFIDTVVPPTCTEDGYTLHECACGYLYTDGETKATGHSYDPSGIAYDNKGHWYPPTCGHADATPGYAAHDFTDTVVPPTCTSGGYTNHRCACGYNYNDGETEATGHTYSEKLSRDKTGHWYAATCIHKTEKKDFAPHTYTDTVVTPTCTVKGYTKHTCSVCKYSYNDNYINATGHSFSEEWSHDETCHWHPATCSHTAVKGDKENHIYTAEVIPPTCTEGGYTVFSCECGYSYTGDGTPATGHRYAQVLSYDETEHWYAALCGHTAERKDVSAHSFTATVTPPTCTEGGYTTHSCLCGYTYIAEEVPAAGHRYADTFSYDETGHWYGAVCGHEAEKKDFSAHSYIVTVTLPTCTGEGYTTHTCICGHSYTDTPVPATGHLPADGWSYSDTHHWKTYPCGHIETAAWELHAFAEDICTECGYRKGSLRWTRIDQNGYLDGDGQYILFGTYPQSEVTGTAVADALTALAGELPTSEEAYAWISFGYCESYGSGGQGTPIRMWYTDVLYSGVRYRGVYFLDYRPETVSGSSSSDNSRQDDNGYVTGTVYWFRYDPIRWRIREEADGRLMLVSDCALDTREYYSSGATGIVGVQDGAAVYGNNYAHSHIRRWLSEVFYETAFSDAQKELIELTVISNRSSDSDNNYVCEDTVDRVFLLSLSQAKADRSGSRLTAYAAANGASGGASAAGRVWLRTPYYANGYMAYTYYGNAESDTYPRECNRSSAGIAPALWMRTSEGHIFSEAWSYDASGHWHTDTCGHPGEKKDNSPHLFWGNTCKICGYTANDDSPYLRTDRFGRISQTGKYILFGSYPQSEVTDGFLTAALTAEAGELPDVDDSRGWTPYGYVHGEEEAYLWYLDVERDGVRYRGILFNDYRYPDKNGTSNTYSLIRHYGYTAGQIWWFRYDPIRWQILSEENGEATLVCSMILDCGEYADTAEARIIDGETVAPGDYAHSCVRRFLCDIFYRTAFTDAERERILLTEIGAASDSIEETASVQDHVYLLPSEKVSALTGAGYRQPTAYARANGAYLDYRISTVSGSEGFTISFGPNAVGRWWLYSAGDVPFYYPGGMNGGTATMTWNGIVPTLRMTL